MKSISTKLFKKLIAKEIQTNLCQGGTFFFFVVLRKQTKQKLDQRNATEIED